MCSRVPITTSPCDFTSRPSGGMRWRSTGSPSFTAAERAFRRSSTSAVSPGSRTISSRIQPAIRRNLRPSSSAIGESWTVRPSTSFRTRRASWWNRSHLEAWQAFARALPDLLGGLVRERDEGDRLGRRAEAAGGVARPRHHRPGLAGPGAGGDHRPVFEARGGPPLVRVQGRQQPVGAGGDLRAPVPPGPFRRGEAARGQPDSERGGRFGEPPQGRRRFARRALARSKALFRHQTPGGGISRRHSLIHASAGSAPAAAATCPAAPDSLRPSVWPASTRARCAGNIGWYSFGSRAGCTPCCPAACSSRCSGPAGRWRRRSSCCCCGFTSTAGWNGPFWRQRFRCSRSSSRRFAACS